MPLGTEVGLIPEDFMLDGNPGLPPKKGAEPPPQFSAHVYCGQTAGWIKMSLGTEVDLGPDDIVLDGDPAPQKGGGAPSPIFGPFLLRPNGWIHQDATWHGGRPHPKGTLCSMGTPLAKKGAGRWVWVPI